MRKLVNISIKPLSLKQTSSSPLGLCEDLKFLTELFGNKDLEPEEEVETLEELQAGLKELGFELSELAQQMETLRKKLAGKLAIKRAAYPCNLSCRSPWAKRDPWSVISD